MARISMWKKDGTASSCGDILIHVISMTILMSKYYHYNAIIIIVCNGWVQSFVIWVSLSLEEMASVCFFLAVLLSYFHETESKDWSFAYSISFFLSACHTYVAMIFLVMKYCLFLCCLFWANWRKKYKFWPVFGLWADEKFTRKSQRSMHSETLKR